MAFDYYTTTTRSMLGSANEVGPKPFILFQYYKTYETAPDGIRPSLERIARDLRMFDKHGKPAKSAVSNLNKILVDKKWIIIYKNEIFLIKSFRNSECATLIFFIFYHLLSEFLNVHSEYLNSHSDILNDSFRNSEKPYIRNENEYSGIKNQNKKNYKNFLEEDEQSPVSFSSSESGNRPPTIEDSDESSPAEPERKKPKTEVPNYGEGTNGNPKTEVPPSGEGKPIKKSPPKSNTRARKKLEEAITRPDIHDDADWLVWLKDQPRYAGIKVLGKYRDMLDWSTKNNKTPSRLRLVNWLNQEVGAMPMKTVDLPPPENGNSAGETEKPYSLDGWGNPHPMTEKQFERELGLLAEHHLADGFDIEDSARFYTSEDWARLLTEIEKLREVAAS